LRTADDVRVAVVGYGYWGPNLARVFADVAGARLVAACDPRDSARQRAANRHPGIRLASDARSVLEDDDIDAVAIATPVTTHFELAMAALCRGKHVLVEKPLAACARECAELVAEAARRELVLMVDHTFAYTGAVRKIRELTVGGNLGQLYYYDSVRVNLGLFQHDVNVLWDLAVHDLAIMDFVLGQQPRAVVATGMAHIPGQPENIAYLTCFFADNLIAHFHVNWLAPVKVRRTLIGGDRQMIVFDDLEPDEKVKVYDKGVSVANDQDRIYALKVSYRAGDMWAPKLDRAEALLVEAEHFVESIRERRAPLTDGSAGLRVVQVLEAATRSLALRGEVVKVDGTCA